jgi:hypothetical protein
MLAMPEEHSMPFYYCIHCLRLSPTAGDILDDLMCLVCGMSLDRDSAGRKVIFTKEEAALRELPWRAK